MEYKGLPARLEKNVYNIVTWQQTWQSDIHIHFVLFFSPQHDFLDMAGRCPYDPNAREPDDKFLNLSCSSSGFVPCSSIYLFIELVHDGFCYITQKPSSAFNDDFCFACLNLPNDNSDDKKPPHVFVIQSVNLTAHLSIFM